MPRRHADRPRPDHHDRGLVRGYRSGTAMRLARAAPSPGTWPDSHPRNVRRVREPPRGPIRPFLADPGHTNASAEREPSMSYAPATRSSSLRFPGCESGHLGRGGPLQSQPRPRPARPCWEVASALAQLDPAAAVRAQRDPVTHSASVRAPVPALARPTARGPPRKPVPAASPSARRRPPGHRAATWYRAGSR